MQVTLVLTHACNLACGYCYMGEHFARAMPDDVADAAVDLAFRQPGDPWIAFFGGEPLLEWERMLAVGQAATDRAAQEGRRLTLQVTTNGTLVTADRARELAQRRYRVAVSLDGTREAHEAGRPARGGRSSFDAALAGARRLGEVGASLEIIAVTSPSNVRHLGASVAFLADLPIERLTLNPCYEAAWSEEDLAAWERGLEEAAQVYEARMRSGRPLAMPTFDNKLLAAVKGGVGAREICGGGLRELAVAPSGRLYPCARLVGEDRGGRLVLGDVRRGPDEAAMNAIATGPADPSCGPCAERWRCGASCACANLAETGTTHLPGGVQCWHERTSARIADDVGHRLLGREPCRTFVDWTYGSVARARRMPIWHDPLEGAPTS